MMVAASSCYVSKMTSKLSYTYGIIEHTNPSEIYSLYKRLSHFKIQISFHVNVDKNI